MHPEVGPGEADGAGEPVERRARPGATRPIAVAAASDEVAWADGKESSLGARPAAAGVAARAAPRTASLTR